MTESSLDLQELEKLRSTNFNSEAACPKEEAPKATHKWRIILEPALVGSMIAINLGQTSLQNFYLRTACSVDLGYPIEICEKGVGEEFRSAEAESQVVVSGINVSRSFVGLLISTIVLLFVGPWSDCSGRRKPLLVLPLLGMCVMTTGVILMLTFPGANTTQVLYAVQIPISLGGNFGLLLAASFSHIGDLCHASGRDVTRTMGTHRAAIQIAHVVGSVSGPQLYRHLGFYGVFPLVLLLQLASLIYVIIMVKDVNVNRDNKVSVFNWRLPLNAVQCLLRKREGNKRIIILLMLIVGLGDRVLLSAEVLLAYMYYRYKFHWDDVMFGSFLAYRNTISFIGTLLILNVLKRRLRLSDEMVGILSCVSYMLATCSLIAATTTLFVFLIPGIGIISQGSQVVQRPLLNKQILPTEQGKIYGILGALESATQTFSSPLYSLLYARTVSTLSDAWLIPGIVLALLQLFSYLITRRLQNIQPDSSIQQEKNIPLAVIDKSTEDTKDKDLINKEASSAHTKNPL
ncbi:proton-coupled folate transporter-like [Vanessa cardui]|uniref:proton-coupled folate transporter-like n=1 Tax=Vanessa cardui TaxID=171605 RepID=UPI001F143EC6|nr:proton-coupled folate transporter-like [Vanessa cardui]